MAGSTNILQWNPGAANQETDAVYAADSTRTGGAPNGVIFASALANKLFYQVTTFVAALAQSMANKGYVISDASLSALVGVMANVVTFADLKTNLTAIGFSANPIFDATTTNGFRFTMSGNVTGSTLQSISFGQILTFVIQNTGPFTFTWPAKVIDAFTVPPASSGLPSNVFTQSFIVLEDGNAYPLNDELILQANQIAALQTAVATAQSTANTALANAATAQSTASTAITDAASAQSTANTALGNANTALAEIASLTIIAGVTGPGRALNTIYQNTNNYPIIVTGFCTTSGSSIGSLSAFIGGGNPPTILVWANENTASVSGGRTGFMFIVPASFFYELQSSGDITGVGGWTETALTV
jgi:hypothetical protein